MGVKNNFSQAVSELIGISRTAVEPEQNKEELKEAREDEALDMEASSEDLTEEDDVLQNMVDKEQESEFESDLKEGSTVAAANPKDRIMAMLAQQQQQLQAQQQTVPSQEQQQAEPQPTPIPAQTPAPQTQFASQSA